MLKIGSRNRTFKVIPTSRGTGHGRTNSVISGQEDVNSEQELYDIHRYIEDPQDFPINDQSPPLVLPMIGYRIELGGRDQLDIRQVELEDQLKNSLYFKDNFFQKGGYTFLGGTPQNPVIISAIGEEKVKGSRKWKVLARTKKDDYYYTIDASSKKKMLKHLFEYVGQSFGVDPHDVHEVDENKATALQQDLLHMEDRLIVKAYKFGVVYCKKGQTNENDMFGNVKASKKFIEFMDMMGTKTKLKGYKGYKGGLDTENDTTGTHAYVTQFAGFDILYHCSTLLPLSGENEEQAVSRKRHIGNDVVVIIFQDGSTGGFSPNTITSKFNHVYLIIQVVGKRKCSKEKPTQYQVGFISKPGVRPHGPPLPPSPIFEWGEDTRNYLLTKLINSERAAYYAPGFAQARTRRLWLKELLEKYGKPLKK